MLRREIARAIRRLVIYGVYTCVSMVMMFFLFEWAHGQVLSVAMSVPAAMKSAEATRTALTPTPAATATPATKR